MSRRSQTGVQDFGSDSFLDIIANIVGILIILIVIAGMKVAHQSTHAAALTDDSLPTASSTSIDVLTAADLANADRPVDVATASSLRSDSELDDVRHLAKEAFAAASSPDEPTDKSTDNTPDTEFPSPPAEPEGPDLDALHAELDSLAADRRQLEEELKALRQQTADLQEEVVAATARNEQMGRDLDARRVTSDFATKRREVLVKEQEKLADQIDLLEEQLQAREEDRQQVDSTLNGLTKRQEYVLDALDQIAQQTRQLREVLQENPPAAPPTDRLNHRIRPVSRAVETTEQHFRLSGGRIAHIPLEGLLERVRRQMGQKVSVVRRFRRAEGVAGPVGGFRMNYVMERQSADPIQALKYGQSGYRISVSRWTITPAETLQAETVEQALRMGSRFRQIIEATPPDTVLTIWLYPGEFQHFGQLRELAHRLNLRVAARPLPDGTPISGSPNGSRSASQ
ncbi:MAG: hypothetical protein NXI04_27110 [Planctomycetaceae bacterium]|nr:hypothetical protein [Planctomycetaceae bacterium]